MKSPKVVVGVSVGLLLLIALILIGTGTDVSPDPLDAARTNSAPVPGKRLATRCQPSQARVAGRSVKIACDPSLDGLGPWIVIQRRGQFGNGPRYFSDKGWNDYKIGFGSMSGEFWLGLENLANITATGGWQLRWAEIKIVL